MCYDDAARPPAPPGATGAITAEDLVLTAADGNRFAAFVAAPKQPGSAQIIIYPDVRGLHQFYKELAKRFAEVGITALALDYFGRTAGLTPRDDSFEYMPHVQQVKFETFSQDVQAALNYLHQKFGAQTPTFVTGFCMGGALTMLSGTNPAFGFKGLLPFYGVLTRSFAGQGTVLENAEKIKTPLLGLFGGADQAIPESDVKQLDEKLDQTGVKHEIVVYPGAPHGFFDRRSAENAEASEDAWKRILEFIHSLQN